MGRPLSRAPTRGLPRAPTRSSRRSGPPPWRPRCPAPARAGGSTAHARTPTKMPVRKRRTARLQLSSERLGLTAYMSTPTATAIDYDSTFVYFEEGDVVSGKVVRIDRDEVLVDIGYKSEGVIPSHELSIRKSVDPHDEVELGEEVDALVLTKEDQDGRLILSKKRARFEKAWRTIERAAESGEAVMGTVIEVVKGGLIVDLGVRGFLPAS